MNELNKMLLFYNIKKYLENNIKPIKCSINNNKYLVIIQHYNLAIYERELVSNKNRYLSSTSNKEIFMFISKFNNLEIQILLNKLTTLNNRVYGIVLSRDMDYSLYGIIVAYIKKLNITKGFFEEVFYENLYKITISVDKFTIYIASGVVYEEIFCKDINNNSIEEFIFYLIDIRQQFIHFYNDDGNTILEKLKYKLIQEL